jgi:hypothetical protein
MRNGYQSVTLDSPRSHGTLRWFPAFVLRMFAIISAFFYGAVVSLLALVS